MPGDTPPARGLTVADLAALLRVSGDKIRLWLKRGELVGVNTAGSVSARARWIILPDALAEFLRRRSACSPPPKPPRRRKATGVDFYPG
jgi:hypothetical protein